MSVILTEETDWIGGQLTSQAVPPDEHPWIESFGGTQTYRAYRRHVRDYYRRNYPLTELARSRELLNPGGGSVSRLTHEPRVSLAVLESMLAPYVSMGRLQILLKHKPISADMERDSVRSVNVRSLRTGAERTIHAKYILDATEQGDLLPLTQTEYVTGFESKKQTGEPHAPDTAQPDNIQSFTVCFAMDYIKGENHTIEKPEEYGFWRDYVPQLRPAWPDKLLELVDVTSADARAAGIELRSGASVIPYRARSICGSTGKSRRVSTSSVGSDMSLVNWPQNDYWLGNLHEVSDAEADRHLKRAKQLSLSLLYWMQTEGGWKGFPGLRPTSWERKTD